MKATEEQLMQRIQKMIFDSKEIGYNPTYLTQMLNSQGAIATCKSLINSKNISNGFEKLWSLKRLDLTIENIILEEEFSDLFTETEKKIARDKLNAFGYKI